MPKRQPKNGRIKMIELIVALVIAGLYILGKFQGEVIADTIDENLAPFNEQLDSKARMILTWGWPYATVRAMIESAEDEGNQ